MPDFYQHSVVSTLHCLKEIDLPEQEKMLAEEAEKRPITLVLPALYSELESPALPHILSQLKGVPYIKEIVFSMNRMDAAQFTNAKRYFGESLDSDQRWRILWNDGPRVRGLYDQLSEAELTHYTPGKGYNVWMAYGYAIAREETRIIAAHDSDILSYDREMLFRLCLPTAHHSMAYEYVKSYYGRVSDRMYGRVTRLFVGPLLRSMIKVLGNHPLLEFLNNFRYPLSGEFSIDIDLAEIIRIPGDWGLEIGMLCEIYRSAATRKVCQVDLGNNFEHKHQHLGYDKASEESNPVPTSGLMKMSHDIALNLLHNLTSEGVVIGDSELKAIRLTYERLAKEIIKRHHDDSIFNGLAYHRHEEAEAVEAYYASFDSASEIFRNRQYSSALIPNWNRVNSALPDLGEELLEAVEKDNA
jgi:glucosyl-3-phosphoglycerate synthase